jgi:hypothetical protein
MLEFRSAKESTSSAMAEAMDREGAALTSNFCDIGIVIPPANCTHRAHGVFPGMTNGPIRTSLDVGISTRKCVVFSIIQRCTESGPGFPVLMINRGL